MWTLILQQSYQGFSHKLRYTECRHQQLVVDKTIGALVDLLLPLDPCNVLLLLIACKTFAGSPLAVISQLLRTHHGVVMYIVIRQSQAISFTTTYSGS